jgi:hypothetical protein
LFSIFARSSHASKLADLLTDSREPAGDLPIAQEI